MSKIHALAMLLAIFAFQAGCSEETQQQADEAATATGEAIESAAEDVKEGVGAAVEEVNEPDTEEEVEPAVE